MFTSFRQRLLFCFSLILGASFLIVILTHYHQLAREKISRSTALIESAYVLMLKDINIKSDLFNQDVHQPAFFKTRTSPNLRDHQRMRDSIELTLDAAVASFQHLPYTMDSGLYVVERQLKGSEALFDTLTALLLDRGYKDYNLEGAMRRHIHWLEDHRAIPADKMLSLRRHEKDYIIRQEPDYVQKLNAMVTDLLKRYPSTSDSAAVHLAGYRDRFNEMVALETRMGIRNNSGLKRQMDDKLKAIGHSLNQVVIQAQAREKESLMQLNRLFLSLSLLLVALSVVASFIIARRITRPLTELTEFITRFIDSQFTVEEKAPAVRTKDEIGKLAANFTLLKDEVISHLKFFKQKVDERTTELNQANQRLLAINEANARFVPTPFLKFLGKNSIEEVGPGDQVHGEMTVLFTDIRAFTNLSETLSPQENFDFVNTYLHEMVPVIERHNGFIDKFIGDTIMAIFPDSPDGAVDAALDFSKAITRFNEHLRAKNITPIAIGTGIHTGKLVLGTIGNANRLETTVISDAVNIASRLEGLCKHYHASIIVSDDTLVKANALSKRNFRYLDDVRVKGKQKSLRVFEILDPEKDRLKISYLTHYESGIARMKAGDHEEARQIFAALHQKNPDDALLSLLLQRCEKRAEHGSSLPWDGVEIMQVK
jgi:adenylate cyclase